MNMKNIPGFEDYVLDGGEVFSRKRIGMRKLKCYMLTFSSGNEAPMYQLYKAGKKHCIMLEKIKRLCNE